MNIKNLKPYVGNIFESSSVTTQEYKSFQTKFRNCLKKNFEILDYNLVKFFKMHFECSAYLKDNETGQFVYISISDVRYFQDQWFTHVLYRTAENEHDFHGGPDQYCELAYLDVEVQNLTRLK